MFAVIYQGYVKEGRESEYQALWNEIASYFKESRGSLGSSLHRTEEGMWLAYSRWVDKAARDASWPSKGSEPSEELPANMRAAISKMRDCLEQDNKPAEICMDVIGDLLAA